jgi:glycosyltransferase involved in cell wall biosynthesis
VHVKNVDLDFRVPCERDGLRQGSSRHARPVERDEHAPEKEGNRCQYVGEVGDDDKVELLQSARATLFPIDWEEPFGLVMIESMACGTPVIATRRGAVPEVIEHGRTGIVVDDYREMAAALELADALGPIELRRAVGERFSPPAHGRRLRQRLPRDAYPAPSALGPDVAQ